MTQTSTDKHQSGIAVRKTTNNSRPAPDFSIESFNYVVGADPCPMFKSKIAVNQRFFCTVLDLFSGFFNDEEKRFEVMGMDTHSSGNCVWDVLPSFDEGETVKLQVIAFQALIEYFRDEDEYAEAQPDLVDGNKLLLADGVMFPTGLMHNHNPGTENFEADEDMDDLMLIRGTVKNLYCGSIETDGEKHNAYIRCIIGTEYGDLEIVHTTDDVKEEQRTNMHVGAVVSGVFTISGDAAIYEYEKGIVLDEANDLSILRSTFAGADAERIRFVFAENAAYLAEYNNAAYAGRGAIVDRLKYITANAKRKCFAHQAVISSVDDGEESLPYGVGKKCIVIAYGEEDNYESIAFIDIDENGRISRLVTSANSRYHFRIDGVPEIKSALDN